MDGIINKWKELGFDFDGIYTGYIAGEKQAEKILEFVKDFKKENEVLDN
jgi:pyridoxine kinase